MNKIENSHVYKQIEEDEAEAEAEAEKKRINEENNE